MSEVRNGPNFSQSPGAQDPSMEEILSSIRRILAEEQTNSRFLDEDEPEAELLLDSTMRVPLSDNDMAEPASERQEEQQAGLVREVSKPEEDAPVEELQPLVPAAVLPAPESQATESQATEKIFLKPDKDPEMEDQIHSPEGLIDERITSQVMNSVGSLLRTISADRSVGIGRQGITLEDMVREELRPLLKSWLDTNLPDLVERVVRAEINKLMSVNKP